MEYEWSFYIEQDGIIPSIHSFFHGSKKCSWQQQQYINIFLNRGHFSHSLINIKWILFFQSVLLLLQFSKLKLHGLAQGVFSTVEILIRNIKSLYFYCFRRCSRSNKVIISANKKQLCTKFI